MYKQQQIKSRTEAFFEYLDYWLLVPIVLITAIGLFVLNQVLQRGYGAGAYPGNLIKQLGAAVIGLLIALLLCLFELPTLKLIGYLTYGVSIVLLIWVHIDGFSMKAQTGADSWILLPGFGTFQPSELAKVGIAMVAAQIFARIKEGRLSLTKGFAWIAFIFGLPVLLIMRETDLGTTAVIIMMFLLTLFVWGIRWRFVIAGITAMIVAIPLLWFFYFESYQKGRILTFLFPGHDATDSYHITQALKAIASGGLTGNASGIDVPVPVKESDFIFSAISEQLGFIGTTLLIILIAVFLIRAVSVALKATEYDLSASYMMIALIAAQAFHFIENIGMNVGLLPITGIPLPFISSGGSSMVVNYFALGLMLNLSLNIRMGEQSNL